MESKIELDGQIITFRADGQEVAMLEKAAFLSGRARSDVIRRLLLLIDTPDGKKILGIVEETITGKGAQ